MICKKKQVIQSLNSFLIRYFEIKKIIIQIMLNKNPFKHSYYRFILKCFLQCVSINKSNLYNVEFLNKEAVILFSVKGSIADYLLIILKLPKLQYTRKGVNLFTICTLVYRENSIRQTLEEVCSLN